MKRNKTFTLIAVILSSISSANAAIYIPSNVVTGDGSADALIENSDESLNDGGLFTMGYFTNGYLISLTDMSANIAAFTIEATVVIGSASASLGGSFPGYFEGPEVDDPSILSGNVLIGRPLFAFVGNGATLAASTEWAIKQIGTIGEDDPFEISYLGNPFGGSAPVFGSFDTFTGNASGFGVSTYQTIQLAAPIPEPASTLLGAFGALALLRRRRVAQD